MNCPVCDAPLRAINKYGVEVDICPGCKGIWLDRGELEKIISMEAAGGPAHEYATSVSMDTRRREEYPYHDEHRHHDDDHDENKHRRLPYDQHGRPLQKRRGSWLGDILGGFGGDD